MAAGSSDPWKISGEERAKHDAQFFQLKPVNGFITGAQARDFFMQSGLSTQVLGQIWSLADMNGDGKMDKLEFSVAMHLIKKKLQGYELPKVLPASLKAAPSPVMGSFGLQAGPIPMGQQVVMGMAPAMNPPMGMVPMSTALMPQASLGTATITTGAVGMPLMANGISPAIAPMGAPVAVIPQGGSIWAMPHASKLKYTQLFNTHDRNKRGFLTGVEARSILMQTGLPQQLLAQIWTLSDVDNDGKLTCDEFCIAMHLSDLARLGRALPPKLPAELIPSRGRSGSFGTPAGVTMPLPPGGQQKDSFGDLLGGFGMAQPAQPPVQPVAVDDKAVEEIAPVTFEDKRKENFDKGQAELERRRALLQEQLKQEENARLEKERREAEKRERIRQEQEARRQEELQRQLERQRKMEQEREEQRRKMMEQREQARRELERQRQMEWERQRKEQLMAEKQREYEQLAILKSQSTNLKCELESLDGKKSELAAKITQVRSGVTDLTTSIEGMRVQRDQTLTDIDRFEKEMQELSQRLTRLAGEKDQLNLQLQTQQNIPLSDTHRTVMHSVELKRTNVQKLRRELEQLEQETETHLVDIDSDNVQLKSLSGLVEQLEREIPMLQQRQQEARALKQQQEADSKAKERQNQEQLKKEIDIKRKKVKEAVPSSAGKQDAWFDFNSTSAASGASHKTEVESNAWSSAFSKPSSAAATEASKDIWGSSDPFASQDLSAGSLGSMPKTKCKVLFAFEARSDDELSINPGDDVWVRSLKILDTQAVETYVMKVVLDDQGEVVPGMEEWYKGERGGRHGWFPKAYVEKLNESASLFSSQPSTSDLFGSAFQPVLSSSQTAVTPVGGGDGLSTSAFELQVSDSFQPTPGESKKAPEGLKALAIYQWKARQDNHLSFNKDDVVAIMEQEDMWWMGEMNGKVGWFPKAYVKLLESEKPLSSSETPSPMGTLERNGSARDSPALEKKGEYYVAMYSYSTEEPSDLAFGEGDMILVTHKDGDWWTGTLGDKSGIFPANYVKKVEIQGKGVSPKAPPRRKTKKVSFLGIVGEELTTADLRSPEAMQQDLFDFGSDLAGVFSSHHTPPTPSYSENLFDLGDDLRGTSYSTASATTISQLEDSLDPLSFSSGASDLLGKDTNSNTSINTPDLQPTTDVTTGYSLLSGSSSDFLDLSSMISSSSLSTGWEAESGRSSGNPVLELGSYNLRGAPVPAEVQTSSANSLSELLFDSQISTPASVKESQPEHSIASINQSDQIFDNLMNTPPSTKEGQLENSTASSGQSNLIFDNLMKTPPSTNEGLLEHNIASSGQSDLIFDSLMGTPSSTNEGLLEHNTASSGQSVTFCLDEASSLSTSSSAAELTIYAEASKPEVLPMVNVSLEPGISSERGFQQLSTQNSDIELLGLGHNQQDSGCASHSLSMDTLFFDDPFVRVDISSGSTSHPMDSIIPEQTSEQPFTANESEYSSLQGSLVDTPADSKVTEPGQKSVKKPEIAMVIAPYTATGSGQLTLEPGNLIQVRQKSPRGWWEGELQARGQRKKIGWFPANYVKLLGSSSSARSTPDPNLSLSLQASGSRSNSPLPQPQPQSQPPPLTPQTPQTPQASQPPQTPSSQQTPAAEQVVALYAYAAQNEDELTFAKDAVITVISRDNDDWWHGEVDGQTGLFPSNYVTPLNTEKSWLSDAVQGNLSGIEKQRQNYIQELITTEESYNADMSIVIEAFCKPLVEAKVLSAQDAEKIFVNWNELIICNKKLLQSLRVRKKMCGKGKVILMIGDILCENLPHMTQYVRFCSCQLSAAALLQRKTETNPEFVEEHKKCVANPATKGMPLSSFLLKPMQRITKYPLIIKEILKYTPEDHPDYGNVVEALMRAEELCNQVNEGVRQKENSDRLEWIQRHVHCDGIAENIIFNSVTNCLGPRKLVHTGIVYKVKSNKELLGILFNDFLLFTVASRRLGPSYAASHIFDSNMQLKMYKAPVVLNEVLVKKPVEADADPSHFQISHIDRVYHLKAPNETERDLWIKNIDMLSRQFLDTERKKRERQHSVKLKPVGRLLVIIEEGIKLHSASESVRRTPGVGRLLVVILEGCDLRASDNTGKSDPYCEVSMGTQEHRTRVVPGTLNPKWNSSMQFTIRDLNQDVLCITVYDRDIYSPNDFLGRTEVRVSEVQEEARIKKGPITKRLILHEVETGEVVVKLDLQLYD